ncbi:Vps5 C terminal like-domain-containing protein [Lipomyces japonicus]|uniref:Vps5 C terminal like-domain-containing protein n=1 Tax=Lipomyces japonicus TaxID=56871 RepID=UPI0034CF9A5F
MARSRKSSLATAAANTIITEPSSSVLFIDPAVNPLGPLIDSEPEDQGNQNNNDNELNEDNDTIEESNVLEIPAEFAHERGIISAAQSAAAAAAAAEITTAGPTGGASSQPEPPLFEIAVGDPVKVGELASSYTVYSVHTHTTSPAYRYSDFIVTRRYRDFRWLYHQLNNNHPGIIIPAPPEKQTVGRFDESFIEGRRAALERMLNKVSRHPLLQTDPDLKIFLESDSLNSDIKLKDRTAAADHHYRSTDQAKSAGGIIGAIGTAFSINGKFVETDEWFIDKRSYIDALDIQLRALSKALDTVIIQRKELADNTADFAATLTLLSEVELSRPLSTAVSGLAEVENRIRDLHERQGLQDMLTLGDTIDEYIRLIDSIKTVFAQRQKAYTTWYSADQDLNKKQQALARAIRIGKTAPERLAAQQDEVGEYERRAHGLRVAYDDICKTVKVEFDRFQREKIDDFRASVETYLESAVESQKEAIELWETFWDRQGFGDVQQDQNRPQVTA